MERFFTLAEQGVRVVCVDALQEGWIYVTGCKVLLIDPELSPADREDALQEVLRHVAA